MVHLVGAIVDPSLPVFVMVTTRRTLPALRPLKAVRVDRRRALVPEEERVSGGRCGIRGF